MSAPAKPKMPEALRVVIDAQVSRVRPGAQWRREAMRLIEEAYERTHVEASPA